MKSSAKTTASSTLMSWPAANQTLNQPMKLNFPKKKPAKKAIIAKPASVNTVSVNSVPSNVVGHLYDWKWRNELSEKVGGIVAFHKALGISFYLATRFLKHPSERGAREPKAYELEKMKELESSVR
jgi:hypothetical protein